MKKLLLTGGTGFIGQQTIPFLQEEGYEIYAVTSKNLTKDNKDVQWLHGNLMDEEFVSSIFTKIHPTHLLHLAWITTPHVYWNSSENFNWVRASQYMFQCFIENGGERIVSAGSCAEYDWSEGICLENTTSLRPQSAYSKAKGELYTYLTDTINKDHTSFAWARVFFAYGPNEAKTRLITSIIRSIIEDRLLDIEYGYHKRDYIYVADVASILVKLLNSDIRGSINIGTGKAISIIEIARTVTKLMGVSKEITSQIKINSDEKIPLVEADTTILNNNLNYYPTDNIESGIKNTIKWYLECNNDQT